MLQVLHRAFNKNVVFTSTMQAAIEYLLREARPYDAILTIGAGSVGRALDQLAMLLGSKVSTTVVD